MNKYICAYCSDVGIRKKTNQDSMLLKQIETNEGQIVFAVLCDGMGGMSKGELASATVIRDFDQWFHNLFLLKGLDWKEQEVITQWKSVLFNSNQELIQYGNENKANLGTTATAILLYPDMHGVFIHIGDTRIYQMHAGEKSAMIQLTTDHTFIAREMKMGRMTYEQAMHDPRRNALLQCIGVNESIFPETGRFQCEKGDIMLLCTDGFRHVVSTEEMQSSFEQTITDQTRRLDLPSHTNNLMEDTRVDQGVLKTWITNLTELNKTRNEEDNITSIAVYACKQ